MVNGVAVGDDGGMSELVSQIHHVATATNDLDKMVAFYDEVFDLSPLPGFPKETVWK